MDSDPETHPLPISVSSVVKTSFRVTPIVESPKILETSKDNSR